MDENRNITVVSMERGKVVMVVPELNFMRDWPRKGTKRLIPENVLREAIYNQGPMTLFKEGLLYIEDKALRQEFGLEPLDENDTETPTVIPLDDATIERYLKKMPYIEFKQAFNALTTSQKAMVAEYAIDHEIGDYERAEHIKKATGLDVIKAIELKRADAEPAPMEENNGNSIPSNL